MNITYKLLVSTAVLFILSTSSISMADPMADSMSEAMDKSKMMEDPKTMMIKLEPMMININTGTAEEIAEALKGVGPMTAAAIIEYRDANGPFASAKDIVMVNGVGDMTFEANKGAIMVPMAAVFFIPMGENYVGTLVPMIWPFH